MINIIILWLQFFIPVYYSETIFSECVHNTEFIFETDVVFQAVAKQNCIIDHNATLARITSESEFNFLLDGILFNFTLNRAFVGLERPQGSDGQNASSFFFVDGSLDQTFYEISGNFPWRFDRPNNQQNPELCVEWELDEDVKEWNDVLCDRDNAYLCRRNCAVADQNDDEEEEIPDIPSDPEDDDEEALENMNNGVNVTFLLLAIFSFFFMLASASLLFLTKATLKRVESKLFFLYNETEI